MNDFDQYYLFADESLQDGPLFSNFYGGALVPLPEYRGVRERLLACKIAQGFQNKELKWQNITKQDLESYKAMVSAFFAEIRGGRVKMRIMFRDNQNQYTRGLVPKNQRYLRLYYQFIKHCFGFGCRPNKVKPFRLRLFLDRLPDTKAQITAFKAYLCRLNLSDGLRESGILIEPQAISEIDSKDYILLQCVDILLGAMAFRLNEKHLIKPPGAKFRGKRTIAKDRLYRHILAEIRTIQLEKGYHVFDPKSDRYYNDYPNDRWTDSYRHWSFRPKKK